MNNSATHHERRWRTFGAVVVVSFAAFFLGFSALQIYQARAVSGWPTVTGTITKVEIEKDKFRSDIYPRYDTKVVYEYIDNGERLIGKNIRLLPVGSKYESELKWDLLSAINKGWKIRSSQTSAILSRKLKSLVFDDQKKTCRIRSTVCQNCCYV